VTSKEPDPSPQLDDERVTSEVGSEGGSPGDLETVHREVGTGSEADELWRPAKEEHGDVRRDEVPGRRSP
jgi:hypothetical protein